MILNRRQLGGSLFTAAIYLAGQLLARTDIWVALLFSAAILSGLLAVFAGGGFGSALGTLNAILLAKFLLVAIGIKSLMLEPSDGPLRAANTTAWVMAIGFFGLFLGTLIQSHLYCPQSWSLNKPFSKQMLLAFSIVLFVGSYAAYFVSMVPDTQGAGVQTGGYLGIARALGSLKSLAIVPPMLYLWRSKTRLWMTHPVILGLLAWAAVVGIFSTGKQDAMEPLGFYVITGFLRYGWRDLRLWSLVSLGLMYYTLIVFPYSQIVRYSGGREGSFSERAAVTKEIFLRIVNNQDYRSTVEDHVSKETYFDPSLAAFSRLAMVGEADRLIYATQQERAFTRWETITWGFKLLTPSFLYPDKPILGAGNYLAHIAGDLTSTDLTTGVSYGIMANWYNAFSFTGVLIGTPIFFAAFYYWIRLFMGDARWEGLPTTSALWFIWLVALYQHSIVEAPVSGIIATLSFPFVIAALCLAAKWLCLFLPQEDQTVQFSLANQY